VSVDPTVSTVKRTVSCELLPEDAQVIVDWVETVKNHYDKSTPSQVLRYLGPVYAVATHREYGGH
jgi:hypothetical protein